MAEVLTTTVGTIPSTTGAILTNSSGQTNEILSIVLTNNNTTTEVVEIFHVPNSGGSVGTAGDTNRKIPISLAADEVFIYTVPCMLSATNDTIQAVTTTASKVRYEINSILTS